MSQLNPLEPLDFDYERFPGVALRATDQKLPGHALADRPLQIVHLAKRIAKLITHVMKLAATSPLLGRSGHAEVQSAVHALGTAGTTLEALLLLNGPPQLLSNVSLQSMSVQDVADAAGAAFNALLDLLWLLLDRWKSPTSLQSYEDLFEHGTIHAPKGLSHFLHGPEDRNQLFASWWVQGNNPLCVRGVALRDIEQAVGSLDPQKYARVIPSDTPAAADAQHRLFWVDCPSLLAGLKPGDYPVRKRLPMPRVIFAVKPTRPDDEPFVPLAIWDDWNTDKLVWSPVASPATANAWTRAMLASLCANQLHHTFVSHFPRTHFVMEGVAVATLRKLPTNHPLFWLLRTHIDGTLGFNETALSSFTAQAGADRFLMAASLRTGQSMMRDSLNGWWSYDFPSDLVQRQVGPDRLPYYPYRDDATLWWDAIASFVNDVVDAAYADDAAVIHDVQFQAWSRVLVARRTRAENGAELIPAAPTSKADLRALLQKIVFTCTAYHAAVQIPLNGFDVSPLTAPCSLYADDPNDSPESMLAKLGTALFQLVFFYFGDIVTYPVGTWAAPPPSPMVMPATKFEAALVVVAGAIDQANANKRQKVGAYHTLLPKKVSRSVDI
jgi:arachidonate 15-lipoxygenase